MKATILTFLAIIFISCSSEVTENEKVNVSRPTIPILNYQVQIGNQIWMTRNLNVSRYRNGDPIPQVTDATAWNNLTTGAWCYYNNNPANGAMFGKLYNWYAINDPRGLAPNGFHVPNSSELTTLITFLGGEAVAGGKLKAVSGWAGPNITATNSSGFTLLPGGSRFFDQASGYLFEGMGGYSLLASTTEHLIFVRCLGIAYSNDGAYIIDDYKKSGYSVRCLRN